MINIGKAIKFYRTQRELSQAELAELAGISISYLSLLERDKRDPTISTIEALANAIQVPRLYTGFLRREPRRQIRVKCGIV